MAAGLPRQRWRIACAWASLACLLAFVALTGLVWYRDPAYSDQVQLEALQRAVLDRGGTPGAGWPQWRGPARDAVSTEIGLLPTWPADLLTRRTLWEQPIGAGFSAVAVADGRACTLTQDGNDEAVVCWDAATGRELWRFRYPARYVNSQGSGPRSTPTIDGDLVYTVGATGILHCLKMKPASPAGERVWRRDLLGDFGADNLPWGVSFSPLLEGNALFVNPGGPRGNSVAALDRLTGKTLWHALDDKAGYSSPIAATLAGRRQVVFFTALGAVGVGPGDGKEYWRFAWKTSYDVNAATPIVAGDYVFLTSGYGRGCVLLKIEPTGDGQRAAVVYRNRNLRGQFSTPVRYKDHLYGFDQSTLKCLNFRTGEVCWEKTGFDQGTVLLAEARLIILGEYGRLALAQAVPEGYREVGQVRLGEGLTWTMPALADGRLYLRDQTRVRCVDLKARSFNAGSGRPPSR